MSFTNPAPGGQIGRTDQGVDFSNIHGPIVAVAQGIIDKIYTGLSGFGTTITEKLSGSGQDIYYALETGGQPIGLTPGQAVQQGTPIAAGKGSGVIEVGYWNPATGRAVGASQGYSEGVATPSGSAFRSQIGAGRSRGIPSQSQSLERLWIQAGGSVALAPVMAAIAMAESGGRINAKSPKNTNGTYDYGLWQINSSHGYDTARLLSDPLYNAQAAVAVERSQGLTAWTTYTSGAYQSYLAGASSATASGPSYGGTRPSGSGGGGGGGGGGSSAPDLYTAYTALRDQPRVPSGPQDVSTNASPFAWFLGVWKSEWDAVTTGAKDVGTAFGDTTRLIGDTARTLEMLPLYTLRAVELIVGFILMWMGIKQSSGAAREAGSNLRNITREVVEATPGLGAEVRMARGRRMGRREGQREAARISARGQEMARRRRDVSGTS